ncbi:MAG: hypothetical protein KDA99_29615 [Planctomycetales bacterium]|nr:hypothetical protein [Planctomycetales bacterium]
MTDKLESRKKKSTTVETPIHTIRAGAVTASIWRRQSPAGYVYFDFSLTRSWKSLSSGSTGYSRNFFARNQAELAEVIDKASRWIDGHEQADLEDRNGAMNSSPP